MCCSVSPGVPVRFSDTVLYAAEVEVGGQFRHVLGYQNKAQNYAGGRGWAVLWPFGGVGNAMILPFPAVPGTMTAANVVPTKDCRHALQDIADAVAPPRVMYAAAKSAGGSWRAAGAPVVQVFEAADIYTVVLARDPRAIPAALDRVPRRRRPVLNPDLFDAYARWYPGWTVALCCFNTRRAKLADPLLWWYEPSDPDRLFLPAVDDHTGGVPDLAAGVTVDHVVAVGSHRLADPPVPEPPAGNPPWFRHNPAGTVRYRNDLPAEARPYLRPRVIGRRFAERMPNGDFVCSVADVRAGRFVPERRRPPAA